MQPLLGLLILTAIVAFGDLVSNVTRARIPMLAVALFTYMLLIWAGMPKNLLEVAHANQFASAIIPVLIVHMGTMLPFSQLKKQWKAILIGLGGIAGILLMVVGVGNLFLDYGSTVAAAGPLTGGIIAGLITQQGLDAAGLTDLVVITGIVLGVQGMVGMPIASNILKKYGRKVKEKPGEEIDQEVLGNHEESTNTGLIGLLPEKYFSNTVILLFAIAGGTLAVYLESMTGGAINASIFALVIGVIGAYFGLFHRRILETSNSFGITILLLIVFLLPAMMNRVTPDMFTQMIGTALILMVLGVIGLAIGGYAVGKLLGWEWTLAIPVATNALYGFPGNFLLCEEVSRTVADTEEHKDAIMNKILPPMLVGGYATVTTASIMVASYLVGTI